MKTRRKKTHSVIKVMVLLIVCAGFLFSTFVIYERYLLSSPQYTSPLPKTTKTLSYSKSDLASFLRKAGIKYVSLDALEDGSFLVRLGSGEEVLFSRQNSASEVASLQRILSRLTIEGKAVSRLDFRFNKPVVVFK